MSVRNVSRPPPPPLWTPPICSQWEFVHGLFWLRQSYRLCVCAGGSPLTLRPHRFEYYSPHLSISSFPLSSRCVIPSSHTAVHAAPSVWPETTHIHTHKHTQIGLASLDPVQMLCRRSCNNWPMQVQVGFSRTSLRNTTYFFSLSVNSYQQSFVAPSFFYYSCWCLHTVSIDEDIRIRLLLFTTAEGNYFLPFILKQHKKENRFCRFGNCLSQIGYHSNCET